MTVYEDIVWIRKNRMSCRHTAQREWQVRPLSGGAADPATVGQAITLTADTTFLR